MKKQTLAFLTLALIAILSFACKKEETSSTSDTIATDSSSTSVSSTSSTDTTGTVMTDTTMTAMNGTTAAATATTAAPLAKGDREFVEKAGKGGMAEVALSQDALTKATNPDVKAFAQRMVDDHGKANSELSQFASAHNVTLPTEVDADGKKLKEKMAALTGESFDKSYMNTMVSDHKKVVEDFTKASASVKDADLKAWIDKTLPTVKDHLKAAEDLDAKLPRGKK